MDVDQAWRWAERNVLKSLQVKTLAEALGAPEDFVSAPFLIVTSMNGLNGAAALMFPDLFRAFCDDQAITSCIILPSSTQEVLLARDDGRIDYHDYAMMVREINEAEVDPLIQLDPVVYRYDFDSGVIQIVAEA